MALLPQDKRDMLVDSKPLTCTGALDRKKDTKQFSSKQPVKESGVEKIF